MAVIVAVRGHGNGASGTEAPDGTREADVAAAIEERFSAKAVAAGHTVHRLQGTDQTLNQLNDFAASVGADVVVEIHLDMQCRKDALGRCIPGSWNEFNYLTAVIHPLNTTANVFARTLLEAVSAVTGVEKGSVQKRQWSRLNNGRAHCIFEFGNLWNDNWRARLRDPATLETCAYGLLLGIHNYLELGPPPPVRKGVAGPPIAGFMTTVVLAVGLYYGMKYLARKGVIPEFNLRTSITSAGRKVVETVRRVVRR
jgi:N-acetylmuramoyl-L-alanine amidase